MSKVINSLVYEGSQDKLVYDANHNMDVNVVEVTISATEDGTIKRGQVIDRATTGTYGLHATSGVVNCIVAEDTEYASSDTSVVVPVYVTGCFKISGLVSGVDLVAGDYEKLRELGIITK